MNGDYNKKTCNLFVCFDFVSDGVSPQERRLNHSRGVFRRAMPSPLPITKKSEKYEKNQENDFKVA